MYYKNILVKMVDTDVVFILIAAFTKHFTVNKEVSVWIEFSTEKNIRFLSDLFWKMKEVSLECLECLS